MICRRDCQLIFVMTFSMKFGMKFSTTQPATVRHGLNQGQTR